MARKDYDIDYSIYDQEEISQYDDMDDEATYRPLPRRKKKKKKHFFRRLFWGLILILVLSSAILFVLYRLGLLNSLLSKLGSSYVVNNMNTFEDNPSVELTYNFAIPDTIPDGYAYQKEVINILLVGVEAINSSDPYKGRSDTMMLLSMNTDTGEMKLVSFLRDTYVEIAGHDPNKLNAAFSFGSMDLLIDTISKTYKIFINAVCLVNFNDFEAVVDELGGVDIPLSEVEAKYLNTTNYISNPAYRNVSVGINHMNGNQALGYCRVRKVEVEYDGKTYYSDFGRTIRQRNLMKGIFESYKNYPKTKLLDVTGRILGKVTSNLSQEQVEYLVNAYLDHPGNEIVSEQMPVSGFFKGESKSCGDCLVMEKEANIAILHHLLYGTELPQDVKDRLEKQK